MEMPRTHEAYVNYKDRVAAVSNAVIGWVKDAPFLNVTPLPLYDNVEKNGPGFWPTVYLLTAS